MSNPTAQVRQEQAESVVEGRKTRGRFGKAAAAFINSTFKQLSWRSTGILIILTIWFWISQLVSRPSRHCKLLTDETRTVTWINIRKLNNDLRRLETRIAQVQVTFLGCGDRKGNMEPLARNFAALENGGYVIHPLTSKTLPTIKSWQISWQSWSLAVPASNPDVVLMDIDALGSCFPFPGSTGELGIGLRRPIKVDALTIEHNGVNIAQDLIDSAPQAFELWGITGELIQDYQYELLHKGSYNVSSPSLTQTFDVQKPRQLRTIHDKLLLKILTNHGNPKFSCLYRVKIHGEVKMIQ